jgi:hypothetical protein
MRDPKVDQSNPFLKVADAIIIGRDMVRSRNRGRQLGRGRRP